MSLADLEIRKHTQPILAELDRQKEKAARLKAELTASEALVTALQEQMKQHAEQHARAVAEAREEQREACFRQCAGGQNATVDAWYATEVRATPLDATPLAARIVELEVDNARLLAQKNHAEDTATERFMELRSKDTALTEALEQKRLGWERAAEKDVAYGQALKERDEAQEAHAGAHDRIEELESKFTNLKFALAAEVERHQATRKALERVGRRLLEPNGAIIDTIWLDGSPTSPGPTLVEFICGVLGRDLASLPAGPRVTR